MGTGAGGVENLTPHSWQLFFSQQAPLAPSQDGFLPPKPWLLSLVWRADSTPRTCLEPEALTSPQ